VKKKMHRYTATKSTSTPPVGMPGLDGHVSEPEAPLTSRPPPGNVAVDPDAPMYGNVTGCCSKPVMGYGKSSKKGMKY